MSERICPDYISQRPRGGIGPPLHSPAGPSASGEGEGQALLFSERSPEEEGGMAVDQAKYKENGPKED